MTGRVLPFRPRTGQPPRPDLFDFFHEVLSPLSPERRRELVLMAYSTGLVDFIDGESLLMIWCADDLNCAAARRLLRWSE